MGDSGPVERGERRIRGSKVVRVCYEKCRVQDLYLCRDCSASKVSALIRYRRAGPLSPGSNFDFSMFDETIAERVRPLAAAFSEGGFARLSVRDGDFEVEFKRAPQVVAHVAPSVGAIEGAAPERPSDAILSEVVGVLRFLRPAVIEGQRVDGDVDLAFVETLGIRNAVRSRGAGIVAAVYVSDGQPVEYGQPLFAIER